MSSRFDAGGTCGQALKSLGPVDLLIRFGGWFDRLLRLWLKRLQFKQKTGWVGGA